MDGKRIWIVDGHNMIFAVEGLKRLQVIGRGEEARQDLVERLEVFALQRQERVLLVFDGNALAAPRDAGRGPFLEVVFAVGRDGAADEFIIREARRRSEQGLPVAVVTDDVRTLAIKLPRDVRRFGVREFWLAHVEPRVSEDDKRVEGDFSDMEREMLALAAATPVPATATTSGSSKGSRGSVSPPRVGQRVSPQDASGERRRLKREKGRLRQERRLKRRGGPR
jgi:predicted RNA-binding protein with PIN domain